jgi:hypothetical protein
MSTLAIERHDGRLMLVAYDAPGSSTCTLIAEFQSAACADTYKAIVRTTMLMAREVGRAGLA